MGKASEYTLTIRIICRHDACKGIDGLHFERGFVAQRGISSVEPFKDCMTDFGYPDYKEELERGAAEEFHGYCLIKSLRHDPG